MTLLKVHYNFADSESPIGESLIGEIPEPQQKMQSSIVYEEDYPFCSVLLPFHYAALES
jgi:hypothetical protein